MNLFPLHHLPLIAARWHHDEHVRDVPHDVVRLLLAAYLDRAPHSLDWGLVGYHRKDQARKVDGPWREWVGHSAATYNWAWRYGKELVTEFRFRFGDDHMCAEALDCLEFPPKTIAADRRWRGFPTPLPKEYLELVDGAGSDASVTEAFRRYYFDTKLVRRSDRLTSKPRQARWSHRPTPGFVVQLGGGR